MKSVYSLKYNKYKWHINISYLVTENLVICIIILTLSKQIIKRIVNSL